MFFSTNKYNKELILFLLGLQVDCHFSSHIISIFQLQLSPLRFHVKNSIFSIASRCDRVSWWNLPGAEVIFCQCLKMTLNAIEYFLDNWGTVWLKTGLVQTKSQLLQNSCLLARRHKWLINNQDLFGEYQTNKLVYRVRNWKSWGNTSKDCV